MKINETYLLDTLKELLNIPSPTGYSKEAVTYVESAFNAMGIPCKKTVKGALVGTIIGKDDSKHRLLSAHVDTLGAMVKEIKGNGRLKLTQIGGYPWNAIEGEYCTIHTADGKEITAPSCSLQHLLMSMARRPLQHLVQQTLWKLDWMK